MTIPNNPDPAEDRADFIRRLNHIYDYCGLISEQDFRRTLITNNAAQLQIYSDNITTWDAAKNQSIANYDAAKNLESRRVVVGSINIEGLPT